MVGLHRIYVYLLLLSVLCFVMVRSQKGPDKGMDDDNDGDNEGDNEDMDGDNGEDDFEFDYGDVPEQLDEYDHGNASSPLTENSTIILPVAGSTPPGTSDEPFLFTLLDPNVLAENKEHIHDFDRGMQHALWYLKKSANRFVQDKETLSVVSPFKSGVDSHDYVSLARYFWPDQKSPNGLPYVRIDGQVNPEIHTAPDYKAFRQMAKHVQYLSLAYFFFDDETYAEKAVQRIHQWFIDPATRMNPHLHYASLVRGHPRGRGKGIIDFSPLPDVLDAISIIQKSASWKPGLNADLRHWFTQYLEWLTTSPNGIEEANALNNHGTYYDVQKVALHIFLNQTDLAREASAKAADIRIASQLRKDGEQYSETARPFSWFYSVYNLRGLFQLCHMAKRVGVDLFTYTSEDKKSVRLALDYLLPAAVDESKWQFKNTGGFSGSKYLVSLLDEAYVIYQHSDYLNVRSVIADQYAPRYNISRLILPWSHLGDHLARIQFGDFTSSSSPSFILTFTYICIFLTSVSFILLHSFVV